MNPTSKIGKGRFAIKILIFLLSLALVPAATAHSDVHGVVDPMDRLCGRIYSSDKVALALTCSGFFALRIGDGKSAQHVSGLWRLERNGVDLSLMNLAYEPIRMSAGREAIHGTLPHAGHVTLKPGSAGSERFLITGMLKVNGGDATLTDAGSGRVFTLPQGVAKPQMDDKFATVEIAVSGSDIRTTRLHSHSGSVPRFYVFPQSVKSDASFLEGVAGKFWLLPPMAGAERAALHFSAVSGDNDGNARGRFEIVGPGLRLDGEYEVSGEKLTLKASRASVRNLELIGAAGVAAFFVGDLSWEVSPRGLGLTRDGRKMLLMQGL